MTEQNKDSTHQPVFGGQSAESYARLSSQITGRPATILHPNGHLFVVEGLTSPPVLDVEFKVIDQT